jgi:hypothetical protein
MSDDSPWKPPVTGGNDEHGDWGTPADDGASTPPADDRSPWARDSAAPVRDPGAAGADAVPTLPPAAPAVPPPPVTAAADVAAPGSFVAPDVAPATGTTETTGTVSVAGESRSRRSPMLAVAAIAIIAIGLAAIFAVQRFTGESDGGATSPDELGQELMAAMDGEDVLGMIDVLLPGERTSLGEPFVEMISELQRLEVLASDLDLSGLTGLDVQLSNQTVEVVPTGADDIVMLQLDADVVAVVDGEALPIGELITDRMPEEMVTEMRGTQSTETDVLDVALAGVEEDGRWYISLLYTAAEVARAADGAATVPDGIGAVGADSPEAAAERFFDQIEQLDVRGMLQGLDPSEAQALQRYAPLFLDEIEAEIAAEADDVSIRVIDRGVRFTGSGDSRTMFVDTLGVEIAAEGSSVSMSFGDGCVHLEFSDDLGMEPIDQCTSGLDDEAMAEMGVEVPPSIDAFLTALSEAFADMEPIGVEMRQRDGSWYLSPMATMTEAMLKAMRALDRPEIEELVDLGEAAADDFFDFAFGSAFGAWEETGSFEEFPDDALGSSDDSTDGSMDGTGELEPEIETSPVDECYGYASADEASACFDKAIAAGEAEEWARPTALMAPECGLTAILWEGGVYELSDEEFTATMSAARPCYEQLLADGFDDWAVPYEVASLDCFEGRNPYQVFDEDYTDRVFECAYPD